MVTVSSVTRKQNVMCANCGCMGHIYKTCNHPVISYGIICYQLVYDPQTNSICPLYLMVQRKDSLSFVEFIRGKYDINNKTYILKLFSNMIEDERERIHNSDFDTLWKNMWCKNPADETNKNFTKEYNEASQKFDMLKNGFLIKSSGGDLIYFNIDYIINNTKAQYSETEWGFPKGRRNINEDDVSCAIREFKEEAGIPLKQIRFCQDMKPYEEIFSGMNKVRYKHVYYIAKYNPLDARPILAATKEIKCVQWFNYKEAQEHIRTQNVERKELLKRLNACIMRSLAPTF
jgi:8-oxo-dGTP pyrophosphatase MutT (NUDIX family)